MARPITVVTNPVADWLATHLHAQFSFISRENFEDAIETGMRLMRNYRIKGTQKKELVIEALRMLAHMASAEAIVFRLIDDYAGFLIDSLFRRHTRKFVRSTGNRIRRCLRPPSSPPYAHAARR